MGQKFRLVNLDREETIIAYDVGGAAKFKEWLYQPHAQALVWLLRQSNEWSGDDVNEFKYQTLGRWAGDLITLIGDYDTGFLYHTAEKYRNISLLVHDEYNRQAREDAAPEELLMMRSPREGAL